MTATISSHLLNGNDGTHAGDVAVSIARITADGRDMVFQTATDSGGRLMVELDLSQANPQARYELLIAIGAYWQKHQTRSTPQIMEEIIIRFKMTDPDGRYHIPIILSPNSYSVWWSS
jgi:5-hydroxyisourate hydrolase